VAAYVIDQGEVLDPERYEEYKVKAAESIAAAGVRYLVLGGDVEVLEGEAPAGRTVLLEFKTMQAALDWYRGAEYTAICNIREGATTRPHIRGRGRDLNTVAQRSADPAPRRSVVGTWRTADAPKRAIGAVPMVGRSRTSLLLATSHGGAEPLVGQSRYACRIHS
jgi:uncharacterized protein (DUF1330 family)